MPFGHRFDLSCWERAAAKRQGVRYHKALPLNRQLDLFIAFSDKFFIMLSMRCIILSLSPYFGVGISVKMTIIVNIKVKSSFFISILIFLFIFPNLA